MSTLSTKVHLLPSLWLLILCSFLISLPYANTIPEPFPLMPTLPAYCGISLAFAVIGLISYVTPLIAIGKDSYRSTLSVELAGLSRQLSAAAKGDSELAFTTRLSALVMSPFGTTTYNTGLLILFNLIQI